MIVNFALFTVLIIKILFLFSLLFLASTAIYGLSLKTKITNDKRSLIAISFFAGPVFLSYFLIYTLKIFNKNYSTLIFGMALSLIALNFILLRQSFRKPSLRNFLNKIASLSDFNIYLIISIAIVVVTIGIILIILPPHGNDTLEYLQLARHMYTAGFLAQYPLMDGSIANGFLAPWTHPPGYVGLLTFAFIIQGQANEAGVAKFISYWFLVVLLIQIITFFPKRRLFVGLIAAALFIVTPLAVDIALLAHVDMIRLSGLMAGAHAVRAVANSQEFKLKQLLWLSLILGLMFFTHSISIIALPLLLAILAVLLFAKNISILTILFRSILIFIGAVLVISPQLLANYKAFGSFVQDSVAIWSIEAIDIKNFLEATRFLSTPADKIFFGILLPFFGLNQFGFFNIFAFLVLAFIIIKITMLIFGRWSTLSYRLRNMINRLSEPVIFSSLFVLLFIVMASITVIAGSNLVIKNARYLLTLQPFIVCLSAYLIYFVVFLKRKTHRINYSLSLKNTIQSNSPLEQKNFFYRAFAAFLNFFRKPQLTRRIIVWGLLFLLPIQAVFISAIVIRREIKINYNISVRTLLDPENIKRENLIWANVKLENKLKQISKETDVILTYRQSDTGFFTKNPFFVYIDERLLPFYSITSVEEAHKFLRSKNIKYIFVPNYSMAEISNTIAGELFANNHYSYLHEENEGWKLIELREAPIQYQRKVISEENFSKAITTQNQWKIISPLSTFDKLIMQKEATEYLNKPSAIPLKSYNSLITRANKFTVATTGVWHEDKIDNAFLTRIHDFKAEPGLYQIKATIQGDGIFELRTRIDTLNNTVFTDELKTLWAGVLSKNKTREITGFFKIDETPSGDIKTQEAFGQIIFAAHHRSNITVHSWTLEKIEGDDTKSSGSSKEVDNLKKWEPLSGISNFTTSNYITLKQRGSNSAAILSPHYINNTSSTLGQDYIITAKTRLSGSTLATVEALVQCDTVSLDPIKLSEKLKNDKANKNKQSIFQDHFINYTLGNVHAIKHPIEHIYSFKSACRPNKVIIKYSLNGVATHLNNYLQGNILQIETLDISATEKQGNKVTEIIFSH